MWPFYWISSDVSDDAYYAPPEVIGAYCTAVSRSDNIHDPNAFVLVPPGDSIDGDLLILIGGFSGNAPTWNDPQLEGWLPLRDAANDTDANRWQRLPSTASLDRSGIWYRWFSPGISYRNAYNGGTWANWGCIYSIRGVDQSEPFGFAQQPVDTYQTDQLWNNRVHDRSSMVLVWRYADGASTFTKAGLALDTVADVACPAILGYSAPNVRLHKKVFSESDLKVSHNMFGRRNGFNYTGGSAPVWYPFRVAISGAGGFANQGTVFSGLGSGFGEQYVHCQIDLVAGQDYSWRVIWGAPDYCACCFEVQAPSGAITNEWYETTAGAAGYKGTNGSRFYHSESSAGHDVTTGTSQPWQGFVFRCTETGTHTFRYRNGPAGNGTNINNGGTSYVVVYYHHLLQGDTRSGADASLTAEVAPGTSDYSEFALGRWLEGDGTYLLELRARNAPQKKSVALITSPHAHQTAFNKTRNKIEEGPFGSLYRGSEALTKGRQVWMGSSVRWVNRAGSHRLFYDAVLPAAYAPSGGVEALTPRFGVRHTSAGPIKHQNVPTYTADDGGAVWYSGEGKVYVSGSLYASGFKRMEWTDWTTVLPILMGGVLVKVWTWIGCGIDLNTMTAEFWIDGEWQCRVPLPYSHGGYYPAIVADGQNYLFKLRVATQEPFTLGLPASFDPWDSDSDASPQLFYVLPNPVDVMTVSDEPLSQGMEVFYDGPLNPVTINSTWEQGGDGITLTDADTATPSVSAYGPAGTTYQGVLHVRATRDYYREYLASLGAVAVWPMQDNDAIMRCDTNVAYNGTYVGATARGGQVVLDADSPNSIFFDRYGTGNYASVSGFPALTGSWSIAVPYFHIGYPQNLEVHTLLAIDCSAGGSTFGAIRLACAYGTGVNSQPRCAVTDQYGTITDTVGAQGQIGFYRHVVATYDATTKILTLYQEGEPVASTINVNPPALQSGAVFIGAQFNNHVANSKPYALIACPAIFDRCLTAAEVYDLNALASGEASADGTHGSVSRFVPVQFAWRAPSVQTPFDTITVTDDVIIRATRNVKIVSDTLDITDDAGGNTRGPVITKVMSDSLIVDDARSGSLPKVATESAELSVADSFFVLGGKVPVASDSMSLSDGFLQTTFSGRTAFFVASDYISVTDETRARWRTVDDSIALSDSVVAVTYRVTGVMMSDVAYPTDYASASKLQDKKADDSITLEDSRSIGGQTAKFASDAIDVIDVAIGGARNAAAANYLDVSDGTVASRISPRTMDDSVSIADDLLGGKNRIYEQMHTEQISVGSDDARNFRTFGGVVDGVSVSDGTFKWLLRQPLVLDNIVVDDTRETAGVLAEDGTAITTEDGTILMPE